jgi:adenine-specific DNA-methyltransferase
MQTVPPIRADCRGLALRGVSRFPATRYQGSKRKLAAAIVEQLREIEFTTVLDAFGGTGAVAYALKGLSKHVTYNDVLGFNHQIGLALIENDRVQLGDEEIESIDVRRPGVIYGDFIQRTFAGIYFTDEENEWLDIAVGNIRRIEDRHARSLAWFALFQSAMVKRPYNLFHRSNLYMRTADVTRSFGNKATWDRSFQAHFRRFADEANAALIDRGGLCRAICRDALDVEPGFDLVYIDTPYINRAGVGVDYHHFYHFLEGMVHYDEWPDRIDPRFKHRPLARVDQPWSDPRRCGQMFRRLFARFRDSILAVSYRSDGIPSVDELATTLREVKRRVHVIDGPLYKYALSTNSRSKEVLLIGCG